MVVGGGQGIGGATARLLGEAGARTVVLDRHRDRAEAVAAGIRDTGGQAGVVIADVSSLPAIADAISEADDLSGGLEILVNITGAATWIPLLDFDEAAWDRDFSVNLEQHIHMSRAAAALWIERDRPGVVCVVSSISGLFASPGHAAYGAAKAGLSSFVRTAAEEWWPSRIRVNEVVPGSVRTPRIEETLMQASDESSSGEMLLRMASPEDVAGPITYLVSDLARKVTGQSIVIEGGATTRFPYAQAE